MVSILPTDNYIGSSPLDFDLWNRHIYCKDLNHMCSYGTHASFNQLLKWINIPDHSFYEAVLSLLVENGSILCSLVSQVTGLRLNSVLKELNVMIFSLTI
jgi:hypothetical protein